MKLTSSCHVAADVVMGKYDDWQLRELIGIVRNDYLSAKPHEVLAIMSVTVANHNAFFPLDLEDDIDFDDGYFDMDHAFALIIEDMATTKTKWRN